MVPTVSLCAEGSSWWAFVCVETEYSMEWAGAALVQLHNVRVHIVYTMIIVGLIDGLEYSTNSEMWHLERLRGVYFIL